jgi:hypothetical protein
LLSSEWSLLSYGELSLLCDELSSSCGELSLSLSLSLYLWLL